ncbi:hypothetical protein PACTADRAFT_51627 [Pachysolen tannophilus NRRL Y-2460]|uniref:Squalene synthase n=1 Tax=Pachysolen tannophilus NRRL Y-2460 TaxID=669874 RepID=A0A1E4TQ81_PACTA|nr:hypothetical protein PACTADRAFT_51627 [Pachysolen tannophilus NRRL Y-2460]
MEKAIQFFLHPAELKAAIQLKFFRETQYPRDVNSESESLKICFELLGVASRSFVAVIMELNPELRVPIMIFYLALRGLDTIEDDTTIEPSIKVPLLRTFHEKLKTKDWTFNGNGPNEKDRIVLVKFNNVLIEYHKLKPKYKEVISDITKLMGNGMADYIGDDQFNLNGVATIKDYDLYCYYVAGLVGLGLTKLNVEAGFANPKIVKNEYLHLTHSMGLFLQKANIIRDFKEDLDDGRSFWPKEIWSKYINTLKDFELKENRKKSLECVSELVLNDLSHVKDVLIYLSLIEETSTYQFCVIPQVMAIATLELVFQNPLVFERNVKIRKGETCQLILESRTYKGCINIFRRYIRRIHHKCPVDDRNYLQIGIQCGQIEQFIESLFPEDHLPIGAKLPKGNEIFDCVKHKVQLDKKIEPILAKETQDCNQLLYAITICVFALGLGLYHIF